MLRIVVSTSDTVVIRVCPKCHAKFLPAEDAEMFRHETWAHRRFPIQSAMDSEPTYVTIVALSSPALLLPGRIGRRLDYMDMKRPLIDALVADLSEGRA